MRSTSTARSYKAMTSWGLPPRADTVAARWARYSAVCSIAPESESNTFSAAAGSSAYRRASARPNCAIARVVACLLGRLVAFQGRRVFLPGEMTLRQTVMGHRPAVGLFQHLDRPIVSSQQIQAHPQPHAAGRRLVLAGLQLADGVAQHGILREVAGDELLHLPDFLRSKTVVQQDGLLDVKFDGLRHRRLLLVIKPRLAVAVWRDRRSRLCGQLVRASEGSRTLNPRITNAVLCRLKLRWQVSRTQRFAACRDSLSPPSYQTTKPTTTEDT